MVSCHISVELALKGRGGAIPSTLRPSHSMSQNSSNPAFDSCR
jgi:hypothetical protein